MDVFQGNYKLYYRLMCFLGLWPYEHSIRTKIKRTFFCVLMISCVIVQLLSLRNIEPSLYDIVVLLSYGCPILMYCIRYVSSVFLFSTVRYVLDSLQHDFDTLNNPLEVQLLMQDSIVAKYIVRVYMGSLLVFGLLVVPTLLQSDLQLRYLQFFGYFYYERNLETNLICFHVFMTTMYGLLTLVCTEGTITIISTYVSGLLHIACYRIRNAVDEAVNSDRITTLNIRPAVEMHRRAINQIKNYTDELMMVSLAIIIVVIISFGVNIYRLFLNITVVKEIDITIGSLQVVLAHLAIICGNNYSGQLVLDTSKKIIQETYNSLWYRLPPKMQKMMLFVLANTQTKLELNFAGLFAPCFEGFSTMMSTSFSYFTLLCSVQ
ncbi:uncharacterized protein LOC143358939 isoform X2 [Halictus rubicundus]|uniref:uncharacterized protein LOC143358939 isoform X2 n=1 Tax=Halictus rubicundus TaxID=77578 RepID=UPI00403520F5